MSEKQEYFLLTFRQAPVLKIIKWIRVVGSMTGPWEISNWILWTNQALPKRKETLGAYEPETWEHRPLLETLPSQIRKGEKIKNGTYGQLDTLSGTHSG
jgi:hypothetical protein